MFGQLSALQILKESNIDFNFENIQNIDEVFLIFENRFESEIMSKYLISKPSIENISELSKLIEDRIKIVKSIDQFTIIDLFEECIK